MSQTPMRDVEHHAGAGSDPAAPANGDVFGLPGVDRIVERGTRALYYGLPRRSFLAKVGKLLLAATGAQIVTLLPVDRTTPNASASHNCNSWYYCNSNAPRLCSCCVGGSNCLCPYGTTSGSYWWGCCNNGSGTRYWVAMIDCCYTGSGSNIECSNKNCSCINSQEPNWCGSAGAYYCTTACIQSSTC